ncbi:hypothetical protein HYE82_31295 [Streptomyces sp. BR123]|uniref:hypothetical protein n=1 Tax=Streptomyces sp. BR123 TaxID=2749828 RepID=UPI0015C4E3DC|nr:hypothetical protein [Streptomyces sp. BR123]NXY98787.1 hypothetical protein [Streptomyces sp. BR123]
MTTCTACPRELTHDDTGRTICRTCEDRASQQLAAIAGPDGLYAALDQHLIPTRRPATGTIGRGAAGSSAPCSLDTLDLMSQAGPVLGTLEAWVRDWEGYGRAHLRAGGTLQQRVDAAIGTLRFNLGWACSEHPAAEEFIDEVGAIWRRLTRLTTGERAPRRIPVQCSTPDCGGVLTPTIETAGETCPDCQHEYGRTEVLRLRPGARTAA